MPNLQVAYIDQKDLGFGDKYGNKPEASAYYINSQLLYKRYVGIGMPAIAFKIEEYENKNLFAINKNGSVLGNPNSDNLALQPGFNYSNAKIYDYALAFNYYLAMQAAKVSLGVDFINPSYVVKTS